MRAFNIDFFHSLGPCRTADFFGIDLRWEGTLLDVVNLTQYPIANRLWVIFFSGLVSERFMLEFIDWCNAQQDVRNEKEAAVRLKVQHAKESIHGSRTQNLFWSALYCHKKVGDVAMENKLREMLSEGEKTGDVL